MKLSDTQIAAISATTGAQPIPDDDPAMGQLKEAIGDHTFYVDQHGLLVLEDTETAAKESELEIVRVGQWADETRSTMGVVPPQPTGQVVDLDAPAIDDAEEVDGDGAA
jgi:hypothetical protein